MARKKKNNKSVLSYQSLQSLTTEEKIGER